MVGKNKNNKGNNMNEKERVWLEGKFSGVEGQIRRVHDDVLVLKTQRDMATKTMYFIAGLISLIVSLLTEKLWR